MILRRGYLSTCFLITHTQSVSSDWLSLFVPPGDTGKAGVLSHCSGASRKQRWLLEALSAISFSGNGRCLWLSDCVEGWCQAAPPQCQGPRQGSLLPLDSYDYLGTLSPHPLSKSTLGRRILLHLPSCFCSNPLMLFLLRDRGGWGKPAHQRLRAHTCTRILILGANNLIVLFLLFHLPLHSQDLI